MKKANIIIACVCGFFIALVLSLFSALSLNYNSFYNTPKVKDCSLDLTSYRIKDREVDYLLNGEWEFFYNEWIETDGEAEKTGIISLPSHWNDVYSLPSVGYASYRISIIGVEEGEEFGVCLNGFRAPFRAFINHKLVYESGTLSKEAHGSKVAGIATSNDPYKVEGETSLTLTLEIGYNTFGGFYDAPWLKSIDIYRGVVTFSDTILFTIISIFGIFVILSVVSFCFFRGVRKSNRFFIFDFLTCLFLLLNLATSKDGNLIISQFGLLDYRVFAALSFLFMLGAIVSFVLKINKNTKKAHYSLCLFIPLYLLIAIFSFTRWNLVFVIAYAVISLALLFYYLYKSSDSLREKIGNAISLSLIILLSTVEMLDYLGFFIFGTEGVISLGMGLFALNMAYGIGREIAVYAKKSKEGEEAKEGLSKEKARSLALQMEPHFIFNNLSSIQALYREGLEKGEDALLTFSSYLRNQLESFGNELIPFNEEINNITNFAHLISLQKGHEVDIVCNIEEDDYQVPAFSIEPFVENALKHSGIYEKEDGHIIISSFEKDGYISIEIADNGHGFSLEEVNKNEKACGMKNAKNRLKMLLNATTSIVSSEEGTIVTIAFRRVKNEKHPDHRR